MDPMQTNEDLLAAGGFEEYETSGLVVKLSFGKITGVQRLNQSKHGGAKNVICSFCKTAFSKCNYSHSSLQSP